MEVPQHSSSPSGTQGVQCPTLQLQTVPKTEEKNYLQGQDGAVKGPGAPPSRIAPTNALLVTGFVRPFRVPDAKALFQQHGDISFSALAGVTC